jgi:16S rRNA (guanine527-N7)-methyltransferase
LNSFPLETACKAQLEAGLQEMGIHVTSNQVEQLLIFLGMLIRWNERFNLTAVRSPLDMVRRHILDSLSVRDYLSGQMIIDVGTGAGLPGIPLSIVCPDNSYYLLDSNQKRQIFVSQVIRELSLTHVYAVHSTVEAYQPEHKFSTILTRAFAPLPRILSSTQHLLAPNGHFLAMMGKATPDQLVVPNGYEVQRVVSLSVPGESAERHVAIIYKS